LEFRVRTPLGPTRALLLALLTVLLPAAPALAAGQTAGRAAAAPPVQSLRAAVERGAVDALPRGITLRRPATLPALRSSAAPDVPPVRAALTTSRVSRINITFVDTPGNAWSAPARAAFRAAADVWERAVESRVPIEVEATARNLGPGVLGGAGPFDFLRNEGATVARDDRAPTAAEVRDDVFEPVALFNARTGRDALPPARGERNPDIEAEFNPNAAGLYLGTDARPAANQIDFRTVVLHEIGHGLGLTGMARVEAGRAAIGISTLNGDTGVRSGVSFDQFTYTTTAAQAGTGGTPLLALPNGSPALRTALTSDQLYWSGQQALTAAGGKVRLHAPPQCGEQGPARPCGRGESPFVEGSSYSHLDERRYARGTPPGLMTPYLEAGETYVDPGQLTLAMLADMGWAVPALAGQRYTAADPVRVLDTRRGFGARTGRLGPGQSLDLQLTGTAGVPADATAVVLNLTGVDATADTYLRAYPTPVTTAPLPSVSNLNLDRGSTRANLVTVAVGNVGRVRLHNSTGSVHVVADLAGWYAPSAGSTFRAVDPVRLLDTRRTASVGPAGQLDLRVAGTGGVPADATAVALTVTAVGATAETDVSVYPASEDAAAVPQVSSLNVRSADAVPNLVLVRVGTDGTVRLRNTSGRVHLLADLAGYYSDDPGGDLFRAVTPRRVLDTRIRLGTPAGSPLRLGPGGTTTLTVGGATTVPRLASAAVLNLTGVSATGRTDLRAYPATAPAPPLVSNLNLVRGRTAADLAVVKLGGGAVRIRNTAGTVGVVVDAAGWFGPAS
jgi:hypothetical protein